MSIEEHTRPPLWALRLLHWFCRKDIVEDIEGDLIERFEKKVAAGNAGEAKKQFIKDVLALFRPALMRPLFKKRSNYQEKIQKAGFIKIQNAMFQNIIKTTVRSLLKQRSYTFINTLGLTIGLAASFLILLWVHDEYQIDAFHKNDDRIYQLKRVIYQNDGQNFNTDAIPQPLEIVLEEAYPEVESVTLFSWDNEALFKMEDRSFKETGKYVRPEFLSIFTFPLIVGDPATALADINSIVISENLAMKLFGENWLNEAPGTNIPVGDQEFKITGVFKKVPFHSTLEFEWLVPAENYISKNNWVENWNNGGFRMVVLMKEGADMNEFGEKVLHELNRHIQGADERIYFQKFSDQYLYSNFEGGVIKGGRIDYVRAMLIVAICILIIASINFMNLTTASSTIRFKEVGMRKILGAGRSSLTFQFLTEALVIALIATLLAVLIVMLILPSFNQVTGKFIVINFSNPLFWKVVLGAYLFTGLMSGLYPAFFLSSFKPLSIIRGQVIKIGNGALFRKILVVFQFTISIVLIIGTISIYRQIVFIMEKNLGLDRENVVSIPLEGATRQNFESYRTELLRIPGISDVASSSQSPLSVGSSTGGAQWDGKDPDFQIEVSVLSVDPNFVKTMKMELTKGNDFSGDFPIDSVSYIINERFAEIIGKENPVGENLSIWGVEGKIIGVVKDFHNTSLHEAIEPLIIRRYFSSANLALIRITGNIPDVITEIEKITKQFNPEHPFTYNFLDEQFEETYRSEMMIADLSKYFTIIAIFISCLGLFGLSSFTAQQRVKEIGIRKVLGASVQSLFMLLSVNFGKLILLAFIIAVPVGLYFSNNWLEQFSYRIDLGPGIFITAGIGAMVIAVVTVSFKAIQAALTNPVETLKDE